MQSRVRISLGVISGISELYFLFWFHYFYHKKYYVHPISQLLCCVVSSVSIVFYKVIYVYCIFGVLSAFGKPCCLLVLVLWSSLCWGPQPSTWGQMHFCRTIRKENRLNWSPEERFAPKTSLQTKRHSIFTIHLSKVSAICTLGQSVISSLIELKRAH